MTGSTIRSSLVAVTALICGALTAQAQPCPTAAPPCNTVTRKIMVTEYQQQPYETTRTVYKTEWKPETFTAYCCEVVPEVHTRAVTFYTSVPVTKNVEITRIECVPTVEERQITRWECVPTVEERQITRWECVPTVEERQVVRWECVPTVEERQITRWECVPTTVNQPVTHYVTKTMPVEKTVSRCVDVGGHYECREVPCGGGGGERHGLFRRHGRHCGCEESCAPELTTVSVYVPNYQTVPQKVTVMQCVSTPVTETVPVTTYQRVARPETIKVTVNKMVSRPETVQVTVNKMVSRPETIKVTVNKMVSRPETIKVTVNKMVSRPETVQVTTCETRQETSEEKFTVYVQKQTPYEATRQVPVTTPVTEKVTMYRCVPVQVEKEVTYTVAAEMGACGGEECGCETHGRGHRRGGLSHRGCR